MQAPAHGWENGHLSIASFFCGHDDDSKVSKFLKALIFGLNSLSGLPVSPSAKANKASAQVLKRLVAVVANSELLKANVAKLDFAEFFSTRSVDYGQWTTWGMRLQLHGPWFGTLFHHHYLMK